MKTYKEIKSKVVDITIGEKGINSLKLENGQDIEADYFFDCTGFKRSLISIIIPLFLKTIFEICLISFVIPLFLKNILKRLLISFFIPLFLKIIFRRCLISFVIPLFLNYLNKIQRIIGLLT